MKKLILILIVVALMAMLFLLPEKDKRSKHYIVVSNYALFDMAQAILPKSIEVVPLIPFGVEPHTYEPTPKSLTELMHADAFYYFSQGMDAWVTRLKTFKSLPSVDLSSAVSWIASDHDHDKNEAHEGHHHGSVDPHYWFDINNQQKVLARFSQALIKAFPQERTSIEQKRQQYKQMLDRVAKAYQDALSGCKDHKLFVTHNAFEYLERNHDVKIVSLIGLSPEGSPNPKVFSNVIDALKGITNKVIFFESFMSDSNAKVISRQTGAKVDMLYTLATVLASEKMQGYEFFMLKNLEKIKKALTCP